MKPKLQDIGDKIGDYDIEISFAISISNVRYFSDEGQIYSNARLTDSLIDPV